MISCLGKFKVYFAHHNVAPLVWCLQYLDAEGFPKWEIAVQSIDVDGAHAQTVYAPKATADSVDGKPSAYLLVVGSLSVDAQGTATIRPPGNWQDRT